MSDAGAGVGIGPGAAAEGPLLAELMADAQAWGQLLQGLAQAGAPDAPGPADLALASPHDAVPAAPPAVPSERAAPSERRPPDTSVASGALGQRLAGSTPAAAAPAIAAPVTALAAAQPLPSAAQPGLPAAQPQLPAAQPQLPAAQPGLASQEARAMPSFLAAALASAGYQASAPAPAAGQASPVAASPALPGNPLLAWAQASQGASQGAPVPAQALYAAQALPGPAAALLARGTDPAVALTLQQGWEAAVLGGHDPISGGTLPSLAQAWGFPSLGALAALLQDLGGKALDLPTPGDRPSVRLAQALGVAAAPAPPAVRDAAAAAPSAQALLLLGFAAGRGAAQGLAGHGLAGFAPVAGNLPATAGAAVLVQVAGQAPGQPPLMLARLGEGLPGLADPVRLGDAAVQTGISAGMPWAAVDLGPKPMAEASTWLPALAAAALARAPAPVTDAAVSAPFGLAPGGWAAHGHVAFAGGEAVAFGAAPLEGSVSALRMAKAGAGPGGLGEVFATYAGGRPVQIDVAPMRPAVPCWRVDDTAALVMVRAGTSGAAALRAAELHHALASRSGVLAQLEPGEGFSTWEGSPLWLALAGIGKPAALGVLLHETAPGRLEVIHTADGEWVVEHAGGGWAAPRRTRHPRGAAEGEALLMDALYGLADPAAPGPGLADWRAAQACMAEAARLPGAEAAWRAQEAWAAVARTCAQIAAKARDAGLADAAWPRLADDAAPAGTRLAAILRDVAGGQDGAGLRAAGASVLQQVLDGGTAEVSPAEGIALAAALGRLPRASPPQPGLRALPHLG